MENDHKNRFLYLSGEIITTSKRSYRRVKPKASSKHRKGYHLSKSTQRKIISSAFMLYLLKQNNVIFPTLTLRGGDYSPEKRYNPCINSFLSNLRKNYGLRNYIWVRENTKKGVPHWHFLMDIPYNDIRTINTAWCRAAGFDSKNAVRLPPNHSSVVRDIKGVCLYITKYMHKSKSVYYNERCYSISNAILAQRIELNYGDYKEIIETQTGKTLKFDYCQIDYIKNFFENYRDFIDYIDFSEY